MPTRLTQSSFTRGELSPRLDARTQLEQYGIGLKTAKNAIIHQEGGISNRMGLEFCGEVKYSDKKTRLMKFVFNSEQTYMLEFGDKYIKFIKDGGYIVHDKTEYLCEDKPFEVVESTSGGETIYKSEVYAHDGSGNKFYCCTVYTTDKIVMETGQTGLYNVGYNTRSLSKDLICHGKTKTYVANNFRLWHDDISKTFYNCYFSINDADNTFAVGTESTYQDYLTLNTEVERTYEDDEAITGYVKGLEFNITTDDGTETYYFNKKEYYDVYDSLTTFEDDWLKGLSVYRDSECNSKVGVVTTNSVTDNTITILEHTEGDEVEIYSPYSEDEIFDVKRSQAGDYLTLTHPNHNVINLVRYGFYDWRLENAVFEPQIEAPTNIAATRNGSTDKTNLRTYSYVVTAVSDDNEESKRSAVASVKSHREANWVSGEYITITWDAVDGAMEYNVYRSVNGVYGYLGTAATTDFTDDNIEPDLSQTAPVFKNPFEDDNNPSCSAYYQQRKIYANSNDDPQTLWASQTAAINNFDVSRPLVATDAITLEMDDREINEIRHLVPMKDLIVLTSNSEWKVNGTDGIFQANPTPAAVIQSCYGSSNIEPVISGSMIIFVQSGGGVVRDLGYDYMQEGYDGDELSIFSSHLFEGKQIVAMSYSKEPYRIVWVIFNDGSAAAMTYNKNQKLCGWTRLVTDGKFKSVDCVREGLEDVAYFVIERTINGKIKQYVERTKTRIVDNAKTAFLVDSGLSKTFTTVHAKGTPITGLDHLEGKEVIVNCNGGIITGKVVEDGAITLDVDCKSIVVGLPYEFEVETLNIEGENTQGLKKLINYVSVKVYQSREDFLFCGDQKEFRHARSIDSINDAGKLFSKDIASTILVSPATDATVKIKQDYPLPLTILSISALVDVQDNENN